MMFTYLAFMLCGTAMTLSGCGEIVPPENRDELAVEDFPTCGVTINGETLSDETFTFQSGETLEIEAEMTYREGIERVRILTGIFELVKASNDEDGAEPVAFKPTEVVEDDENDSAENVLHMRATWTPEVEPGTYELRLRSGINPLEDVDFIPTVSVFSSIVEVRAE